MKILKSAKDDFRMTLSQADARIFINCMAETIRQISPREYQLRMGATQDQIKNVIASLEAALK